MRRLGLERLRVASIHEVLVRIVVTLAASLTVWHRTVINRFRIFAVIAEVI
jgi:hypothetical protein